MRDVTKDEFFAAIGPLDVNPRSDRNVTIWETPRREVIGRSEPGYMNYGTDGRLIPKRWFLAN
jgi:hypothetical protein